MTRDDLGKAKDLLQRYGDERDRLFDRMQSLLTKPDSDSLVDDWKNDCEKASDLLESLNIDMPKSPTGALDAAMPRFLFIAIRPASAAARSSASRTRPTSTGSPDFPREPKRPASPRVAVTR
jgi:hypothetical protein